MNFGILKCHKLPNPKTKTLKQRFQTQFLPNGVIKVKWDEQFVDFEFFERSITYG